MILDLQLHQLSNALRKGDMQIPDLGELLPVSVMLHNLDNLQLVQCAYMNNWGCEHLGTSVDEINKLGEAYYERYFDRQESLAIFQGMTRYFNEGDFTKQYSFFQRVKLHGDSDYTWFYSMNKVIKEKKCLLDKSIMISCPIIGVDNLVNKFSKVLDQDNYIRQHYLKFAKLTKREKEIIGLLSEGLPSSEIADMLFISVNTIITHRKNIIKKLEVRSFAELVRFAIAFDLVKY